MSDSDPLDHLDVVFDFADIPPDGFHKDEHGAWVDEEEPDADNSVLEYEPDNALPETRTLMALSAQRIVAVRLPQVKALGPLRREIRYRKLPMRGLDIAAVHRALARAGCAQWKKGGAFPWVAGIFFFRSLRRFQRKMKLPVDGVYGPATHRALSKWFDARAIKSYQDAKIGLKGSELKRQRLRSFVLYCYHTRGMIGYTMSGSRMTIIRKKLKLGALYRLGSIWEDCSSWIRGIYFLIGHPDIMGFGYHDPRGYTGTMGNTGFPVMARLENLKIGDCFRTGMSPFKHTWIYIGSGLAGSHGKMSDPRIVPWNYRPVSACQRYIAPD